MGEGGEVPTYGGAIIYVSSSICVKIYQKFRYFRLRVESAKETHFGAIKNKVNG
jgi:hypothetical protein